MTVRPLPAMNDRPSPTPPILSICIPAYNRPTWLHRALNSIIQVDSALSSEIEIVVSDDSNDPKCAEVAQVLLDHWPGKSEYQANTPRLGMAQNWNQAIKIASGKYVMVLHDDDFLYTDRLEQLLQTLKASQNQYPVILFGVKVVNEQERPLKTQTAAAPEYLAPKAALMALLSNSSFVRFPAIAMANQVFEEVGYFDPQWGEPTDIEMWIRLFSQYGVYRASVNACAYTVHAQALTMGVFNPNTVQTLLGFFQQVSINQQLSQKELQHCQRQFFHQFILAGAFRMLRRGKLNSFHNVMQLFQLPAIQTLTPPRKWVMVRILFEAIAQLYAWISSGKNIR